MALGARTQRLAPLPLRYEVVCRLAFSTIFMPLQSLMVQQKSLDLAAGSPYLGADFYLKVQFSDMHREQSADDILQDALYLADLAEVGPACRTAPPPPPPPRVDRACRVFTCRGGGGSIEPPTTGGFGKRAQLTGTINQGVCCNSCNSCVFFAVNACNKKIV